MKTFIFNYEAQLFLYLRNLIPNLKELTYANSDDMFYAMSDVRKFPCAYYMREEDEWSLPRIYKFDTYTEDEETHTYTKERLSVSVIEQHYKLRIYVEKQSEMLELANRLTVSWSEHPHLNVSWEWTPSYIGNDTATTDNLERVNMFFTGCRVGEVRPSNDTKGSYRYVELTWTSQMLLNYVPPTEHNVNLVHEVRMYVTKNGDVVEGTPLDEGYLFSVLKCDHKEDIHKIYVTCDPDYDDELEKYYYRYMLGFEEYRTYEEVSEGVFAIDEPTEGGIISFDLTPYHTFQIDFNQCSLSYITDFSNFVSIIPFLTYVNVSDLDTSNSTNFSYFIYGNRVLEECDVSNLDFSNGEDFGHFMSHNYYLQSLDLSRCDFSKGEDFTSFLGSCNRIESLTLPTKTFGGSFMGTFLYGLSSLRVIDLDHVDFSKTTSMSNVLNGCYNLTELRNLHGKFDNATDFSAFLSNCGNNTSLGTLDMSDWNMTKGEDFRYFLRGANFTELIFPSDKSTFSLGTLFTYFLTGNNVVTEINLRGYDFGSATTFTDSLSYLDSVVTIDLSDCDLHNVTSINRMLIWNPQLTTLNMSRVDLSNVTNETTFLANNASLQTVYAIGCNQATIDLLARHIPEGCELVTE